MEGGGGGGEGGGVLPEEPLMLQYRLWAFVTHKFGIRALCVSVRVCGNALWGNGLHRSLLTARIDQRSFLSIIGWEMRGANHINLLGLVDAAQT